MLFPIRVPIPRGTLRPETAKGTNRQHVGSGECSYQVAEKPPSWELWSIFVAASVSRNSIESGILMLGISVNWHFEGCKKRFSATCYLPETGSTEFGILGDPLSSVSVSIAILKLEEHK